MSRIKSTDTAFELKFLSSLSKALYPQGYRYRKHYRKLVGKPDIVFVKNKLAIFLDSDFWHGKNFSKLQHELKTSYWQDKIRRNMKRDKDVNRALRKLGWEVMRFAESQLKAGSSRIIKRIEQKLKR